MKRKMESLRGRLHGAAARARGAAGRTLIAFGVACALTAPAAAVGPDKLVPVPSSGLEVRLWSDPDAGSLVRSGDRVRLYLRTNADCYATVFSVDTEGRVRLLFPGPHDDGWVEGGRTWRIPRGGAGYDLRFAGPPGIEYVYAVASYAPMRDRYPVWLSDGRALDPEPWWWEDDCEAWETGWVVGDPFYRMRGFCEHLVPDPHRTDTYASAYIYWHLGRRVQYPRYLCSDCHWGGWIDPYGPTCSAVSIRIGDVRCSGWIDFRVVFRPVYTYCVDRHWRPRWWDGPRWDGPDGRWVWSSADSRQRMREHFRDARDRDRFVRDGRDRERHGWDRSPKVEGKQPESPWSRSHEERITRSLERLRGRESERMRTPKLEPNAPRGPDRPGPRVEGGGKPGRGGGEDKPAVREKKERTAGPERAKSPEPSRRQERSGSSQRSRSGDRGTSSGAKDSGRSR